MRRVSTLLMVLVLGLSCQTFIACSGGERDEPETSAAVQSSSADLSWKDVPAYPGAERLQGDSEMAKAMIARSHTAHGDMRFWETDASSEAVISFYESELPQHDWEKIMGMKMGPDAHIMTWHKKVGGEDKGITVNVSPSRDEGKVHVAIIMGQDGE